MTEDRRRGADGEIVGDERYPPASSTWVGAFERVMGDHNDESQYPSSSSKNRPRISRQGTSAHEIADVNPPNRSAAASPFKTPSDDDTYNRQRMRSGSIGTNSSETSSIIRPSAPRKQSSHVGTKKKKNNIGPTLVTVSPKDGITLKDVYFNHAPSLQPLHIENLSDNQRVLLRLSSDLGRAMTFLKKRRSGHNPKEPIVYPGNTVVWAQADGLHPSRLRDIRHLVANLESSDSLILEAGASEDVFIAFRPSDAEQERLTQERLLVPPHSPNQTMDAGQSSLLEPRSPSMASSRHDFHPADSSKAILHHFVEVHGLISLRASILSTADITLNEGDGHNRETISSNASNMSSSSSSRPPSFHGSYLSSNTSASIYAIGSQVNSQQIDLPFSANYCRPSLGLSRNADPIQQNGIVNVDFGDIFVEQKHEMEINVHNQSEIGIFCQARLDDADNALQTSPLILQSEQGEIIHTFTPADDHPYKPFMLPSACTKTIKIILKPNEACRDYEQMITFINMHNAGNSIRVMIRANILGEARDDALAILTGEVMDFGDCPGGHWTGQLLVLRNNCAQYLDVHFGVEKGIEASFQLAEMVQKNTEEEQVLQQELPDAPDVNFSAGETFTRPQEGKLIDDDSSATDQSSSSQSSRHPVDDQKSPLSAQEARTPLAKAQFGKRLDEPPYFALPGPDEKAQACEGPIKYNASSKGDEDDEADLDASSVTSQAGSLPGSPQVGSSQMSGSVTLPSGASSRPDSVHWSDVASSEGGDKESGSLSRSSRPVSAIFASSLSSVSGSHQRGDLQGAEEARSTRSELSNISQESRLGPFLSAASTQHGGSHNSPGQSSRSQQRITAGSLALKGMHGGEQVQGNQLEELFLRPGGEYRVIVSHRPARGQKDVDYSAGKLMEKTFRLLLDYARSKSLGTRSRGGRERKNVLCRIRTCTSFISVSPKMIDFGAANVGSKKSASFTVANHSELTARVDLRFVSKVLSMYRDEISIPALQSLELRVDFFPRRVNESYKKQVTVANLLNRHNDEILEVRSKNIDEQKVSFHSIFYRILTSTGSNYLDFGDVNINCARVRSFSIENTSKGKLTLELSAAHAEDLKLYIKAKPQSNKENDGVQGKASTESKKTPNRYAELEASDEVTAVVDNDEGRSKTSSNRGASSRTNGVDLKERFLESMSQEMPAVRKENTTWRTAQKDSHYRKGTKAAKGGQKKGETNTDKKDAPKKAPINLVSALKKGGKGRLTQKYGRTISFKDQKLLSDFEYLDLATGPPVDGKRISVKSRKYQMLDTLETGKIVKADIKTKSPQTQEARLGTHDNASAKGKSSITRPKSSLVAKSTALAERSRSEAALHDASDVSKLTIDELIAAVEAQGSSLSTFFLGNPEAEEQSVRTEINLQRELQNAISTGRLQSVETLSIEAKGEQEVIAIYTPNGSTRPHIQGNARKQDSRIFLRLIEFDRKGVEGIEDFEHMSRLDIDELPVRELMVKSNICRSLLELSQPHINFGQMDKGETKTRKILIQNRSEWALRFCIRKSGNISSGDIKLKSSDRYGVVPGHGKREVEFVFCPTLTGAFQEKLTVENVADRDRDETVFLKANVRKVSNFRVEPTTISFVDEEAEDDKIIEGLCMGKISTKEQSFTISNVSTKPRTFVVGIDDEEMQFTTFNVDVLLNSSSRMTAKASLSREEEEEVEHISQKLKIANRKGQEEKIKKYADRLNELGVGSESTSPVDDKISLPASGVDKPVDGASPPSKADIIKESEKESSNMKQDRSTVILSIPPNQSKKLMIRLRPILKKSQDAAFKTNLDQKWQHDSGQFSVNIRIHEQKNTDEIQIVEMKGRVQGHRGGQGQNSDEEKAMESHDGLKRHGWVTFSATSAS